MPHWSALYLASEWAIRVAMLVYVPQRRAPAAARSWLLFIFLVPWAGLAFYLLFGRPYLPRRRREVRERVSALIRGVQAQRAKAYGRARPALPDRFEPVVRLAESLGEFLPTQGNEVELIDDYEGAVARLVADIDGASRHVHLLYYIFADDRTGSRVIEALSRARARGVECRVIADSLGSKRWRSGLVARLADAGVETTFALPARLLRWNSARFDLRNHRKIAVVDGVVGYVGSQNLVDRDFKPGIVNQEVVARVRGPVVRQLQAVLLSDRLQERGDLVAEEGIFPEPVDEGGVVAQVLPSGPGYPQENNERLAVALLHAARERAVLVTPYFIPDETLFHALQSAASRGVEVHVIVSAVRDQLLVGYAQRSFYDELLAAGVRIHLYGPRFLHAKHLTIDGEVALVGSSNFDIRSFALNDEVSLVCYDRGVAERLGAIEDGYLAASETLTRERWAQRPWAARLAESSARLADSFL